MISTDGTDEHGLDFFESLGQCKPFGVFGVSKKPIGDSGRVSAPNVFLQEIGTLNVEQPRPHGPKPPVLHLPNQSNSVGPWCYVKGGHACSVNIEEPIIDLSFDMRRRWKLPFETFESDNQAVA